MADIGAESWIIHGTLLGWWWNRKVFYPQVKHPTTPSRFTRCCADLTVIWQIMPWDSDIDVQMSVSTVHYLASYYNMTIHRYQKRDYMLEINPKYTDGSFEDKLNVIDGRWIDIQTGLFIDITAIRPKKGVKGVVVSKDKQEAKVRLDPYDVVPACPGTENALTGESS